MKILDEHPLAKAILAISAIAGIAVGLYKWGEEIRTDVRESSDPKKVAENLATNKEFVSELAKQLANNEGFVRSLVGPAGPRGPMGPEGRPIAGPVGPKGDRGDQGAQGKPGKDGASPDVSLVAAEVIAKLKRSAEIQSAISKLNSMEGQAKPIVVSEGGSGFLLDGALQVAVTDSSTGKCNLQVSVGTTNTGLISMIVGDSFDLSKVGIAGHFLSLVSALYNPPVCTFRLI